RAKPPTRGGAAVNTAEGSALAGATVRLYRGEGRTPPPVEIAKTVTDADGRYTFTGLVPPRPENHLDCLSYAVLGFADGWPVGSSFRHFRGDSEVVTIRMTREKATLAGKVLDAAKRPLPGATVSLYG